MSQTAPLHFTQDYHTPAEFQGAADRWVRENDQVGAALISHMWWQFGPCDAVTLGDHRCEILTAHLEPGFLPGGGYTSPETVCHGPGSMLYQANCEPCRWHIISESESAVVEGWHDHAAPGWRALPVIPSHVADYMSMGNWSQKGLSWIEANYPVEWQGPGHPIISERKPHMTRHVPGYSPWRGYDLAHTAVPDAPPTQRPPEQMTLF